MVSTISEREKLVGWDGVICTNILFHAWELIDGHAVVSSDTSFNEFRERRVQAGTLECKASTRSICFQGIHLLMESNILMASYPLSEQLFQCLAGNGFDSFLLRQFSKTVLCFACVARSMHESGLPPSSRWW
jgi:hypothetical protein